MSQRIFEKLKIPIKLFSFFHRLKTANLIQEIETRDNFDEETSEVLVDGILKFEFLRVKASSPITLQCSNSEINSTGRNFCTNFNLTSLALGIIFFSLQVLQFLFYIITPDSTLLFMSSKIGCKRNTTLHCHRWNTST